MTQFELTGAWRPEFKALDYFTQGFVEALFFTAPDGGSGDAEADALGDLTERDFCDLSADSLARIVADCKAFQETNAALLEAAYSRDYDEAQAGRDFLFTRNRHGVGYWDRKELEADGLGDKLTEAAHRFSEGFDLYLGDDDALYVF